MIGLDYATHYQMKILTTKYTLKIKITKCFITHFYYHCGYRNKDLLIKAIQKIENRKEPNQKIKQSSINNIDVEIIMSQAGVSPNLIKQHANYLISTDDVHTRS